MNIKGIISMLIVGLSIILTSHADSPPVFSLKWGTNGSAAGLFDAPQGIAVDGTGNVFVTDYNNHRVQKFDPDGRFLAQWGSRGSSNGQFSCPLGICIKRGLIYVSEADGARIQCFDLTGKFVSKWGSFGTNVGQFYIPLGIAVDDSTNVYVADQGNHRIQKFDSAGRFLKAWGSSGQEDGQFVYISGLAIDAAGAIYTADQGNGKIQKFDPEGRFLGTFAGYSGLGIAASRGAIYLAQRWSILKFDSAGTLTASWGESGTNNAQFSWPFGLAFDPGGSKLYVADTLNHRVQKFQFFPPVIMSEPVDSTANAGQSIQLSAAASGSETMFYQWRKDGLELTGATNTSLNLTNISPQHAGNYDVIVTNSYGSVTSAVAQVTVIVLPELLAQPSDIAVVAGATAEFQVTAQGTAPLRFQWRKNGVDIVNATNPVLSLANVQPSDAGTYAVVVGNVGGQLQSSNALLRVLLPPVANPQKLEAYQNTPLPITLTGSTFNTISTGFVFQVAASPTHGVLTGQPPVITYVPQAGFLGSDQFSFNVSDGFVLSSNATVLIQVTNVPWGGKFNILHHFAKGPFSPGSLVQGNDGNFYAAAGGGYGDGQGNTFGVVVKMTPSGVSSVLHCFDSEAQPSDIICGTDGQFYGTCSDGVIYKLSPAGTFTELAQLEAASFPSMLTQAPDGSFYGTTFSGGSAGLGTVFRMSAHGEWRTLVEFQGTNGAHPCVGVTLGNDGALYGATAYGGPTGSGTFFRVSSTGQLSILGPNQGGSATSRLLLARNGEFYGMVASTGGTNLGSVFKLKADGQFAQLAVFDGQSGFDPRSSLIQGNDGFFYGVTSAGGQDGGGIFFRMTESGFLVPLHNFKPSDPTGYAPLSAMVQAADGLIYGTTSLGGGPGEGGAVFKATLDGTVALVGTFTSGGANPSSGLLRGSDGYLYGTTTTGGNANQGTIYKLDWSGRVTTVASFTSATGGSPRYGLLQTRDGRIYGTTRDTVFRLEEDGTLAVIASLATNLLTGSISGLTEGPDGNLYGTSSSGGVKNRGAVFKTLPTGGLSVLASFLGPNGRSPQGGLALGDQGLYGVTLNGGVADLGTVFKVSLDGTVTTLHSFDATRYYPKAPPVMGRNGMLYGTTSAGGQFGFGVIYRLDLAGTMTTVASFNQANGAQASSRLLPMPDGSFYGVTYAGGTGLGNVFRLSGNGELANVFSFSGPTGINPQAELSLGNSGRLYGTTSTGGRGFGTVFEIVPLLIETQPVSQTIAPGSLAEFVMTCSGTNLQYQWFKNGSPVPGASNASLSLPEGRWEDEGTYLAMVRDPLETNFTANVTLTIARYPGIDVQPATQWGGAGSNVVFSVVPTGTQPLSYQWFKNGVALMDGNGILGVVTPSLTLSGLEETDAGAYFLSVSNVAGAVFSSNALLTVISPPKLPNSLPGQAAGAGSNIVLHAEALGTAPLAYKWFKDGNPLSDNPRVSGAETGTLSILGLSPADSGEYSLSVSNLAGMDQRSFPLSVVEPPILISQPGSRSVGAGSNSVFQIQATGTAPFVYQWFKDLQPLIDNSRVSGASTELLTISGVSETDAGAYSVFVTNLAGAVRSSGATLEVVIPPQITAEPETQTNRLGSSALLSVHAVGTMPLKYQWRMDGIDIVEATTTSLKLDPLADTDTGEYSVWIGNAAGSVTSSPAFLMVSHPPVITAAPSSQTANEGEMVIFAVGAHGASPFRYQWQKDGVDVVGATNKQFALYNLSIEDAGQYCVLVSNADGTTTSAPPALLTVIQAPAIASPPVSRTCRAGEDVGFTVQISGSPSTFQWFRNGERLTEQPGISGVETATLNLSRVSEVQSGDYSVCVSNRAGVATSPAARLTVIEPLAIKVQPVDQALLAGQEASLAVEATGLIPLRYQWQFCGTNLLNGSDRVLHLNPASTNDSGGYSVIVSDDFGSVTSRVAIVSVYQSADAVLRAEPEEPGTVSVSLTGMPGLNYGLFGSSNLSDWVLLQTNASPFQFKDTNAGSLDRRFYRSVYLP